MSKELRNLWENINAGNFKQALVKVHKELKKQPDNAYFLAVNGFVLLRQKKTEDALVIARRVAASAPPNVHVLNVLADVFSETGNLEELGTLMETANRKSPKDAEIIDLWNNVMASESDIRGMLKASMAQLKLSGARDVTFKTVLCMALAHAHPATSDTEKKLYPMLAGRYLEKLSPYKDPQEVYVQAQVYLLGGPDKAIEYLQSEDVRKWGSLDLDVMLLDLLKKSQQWSKLQKECLEKLTVAQHNWIYWSDLVLAASKLGDFTQAAGFITKHKTESRNAYLAYVKYVSEHTPDQLLAAVTEFFTKFGSKRSTFDDLRPYVQALGSQQNELLAWLAEKELTKLPTSNDVTWQVNIAKIKYLVNPNDSKTVETVLADYHRSVHLLKGKDPKDYHSGCDFVLIAASYLVEHADSVPQALETAAVLLELACETDVHNFYLRMWLVRIYLALGCYSIAKIHFNALSIKSVQQETLSFHLVTRLSSTRPDARFIEENSDIYTQAEESSEYIKYAFSKRAYTQVEGILELNEKLDSSLYKRVMDIELLRCKRFTKFEPSADAIEQVQPKSYSDNRDFDAMWDLADDKLSKRFTLGPIVDEDWVKTMIARERAIRRLINEEGLSDTLGGLTPPASFTEAEVWSLSVVVALVKSALAKKDASGYDAVARLLTAPQAVSVQSWEYFHWHYTVLETCKVVSGYLNRLKGVRNQLKPSMDGLEALKKAVDALVSSVKKSALEARDGRMERYKSTVDALVSTNPIPALVSVDRIEDLIDRVEASREENLVFMRAY